MQTHPVIARNYFARVGGVPATLLDGIVHHHELLDGSGYPDGLMSDAISTLTRMLTVCDMYAGLTEERAYKPAKPPLTAIAVLTDMAGQGKLEYRIVSQLAKSLGLELPERQVHAALRRQNSGTEQSGS